MKLVRWSPMLDVRSDVDRLFGSWARELPAAIPKGGSWAPPADVKETADGFEIRLDLPGMEKKEVKVSVYEDTVTVRGERREQVREEGESWHRVERFVGAFERSFVLGASLDSSKVKATYKDGVLQIGVPKAESAKPKEIDVQVSG